MTDIKHWLLSSEREMRQGGKAPSVLLRRTYGVSIDDVWSACTDPKRLSRWFGNVSGEMRVGETVLADVGEKYPVSCCILRCDKPTHLTITWAYGSQQPDEVHLRLTSKDGRTALELEHRFLQAAAPDPEIGAGWEDWIYKLSIALQGADGRAVSSNETYAPLLDAWAKISVTPDSRYD
jgi:uncharacterized protein YndB with AHSA1/START domain